MLMVGSNAVGSNAVGSNANWHSAAQAGQHVLHFIMQPQPDYGGGHLFYWRA